MALLIVALEIVLLSSFILVAESDHGEYHVPILEFFRLIVYQFVLSVISTVSRQLTPQKCVGS
jgi:hypothetical protein